jgi:acetyltransferase-like isoleucine patch superfamily enzyme/acyl carrier protein
MSTAAKHLARCTTVGARPVVTGVPHIDNGGRLDMGADIVLASQPLPSHLVVSAGGDLTIGDRVRIGFGAAISCQQRVCIGDDTFLGPYVSLADSDFHVVGDREASPEPRPVVIGRRVRIGARVMVLPGTTIGDDVEVAAGSVVGGTVPARSRVAGVPARPITAIDETSGASTADAVLALVQRTLALPEVPALEQSRDGIAEWDSLGALRLLIALEEDLGVRLGEEEVLGARRIADLVEAVVARGGVVTRAGVSGVSAGSGDLLAAAVAAPIGVEVSDGGPLAAVAELVRHALDLPTRPTPTTDRDQIPEWDSFGALKILLAAEERFGVSLGADDVAAARSVADLHAVIQRANG